MPTDELIPLCKRSYFEPELILADWRRLEDHYRGKDDAIADRFARLIEGLLQDHSEPNLAPSSSDTPRGRKRKADA